MTDEGTMPAWLERALATPGRSRFVEVAGCPIHSLRWGDPATPGLILIAGAGGHAHWFAPVAPLFADQFHVVAIDPGGCGDSGWRETYTMELIVAEIMAVAEDAGMLRAPVPPILVGHSAGGQFAVRTAIAEGRRLGGVIAVDAIRYAALPGDPATRALGADRPPPPPPRLHSDAGAAIARFRLQPEPQVPVTMPGLLDYIARHSVRQFEGGWGWKFDGRLTQILSAGLDLRDALARLPCEVAAIYGEKTHLADETVIPAMTAATGGRATVFVLPGSGHYPMLDNPLAFVAAIKGVATTWIAARR